MAVTRRGYIFGAFLSSILSVLLIVISLASDSWVVSTATAPIQTNDSYIQYGLFRGTIEIHLWITPTSNTLYVTCIPELNACAASCKTVRDARLMEVRALANGLRPNPSCIATTSIEPGAPVNPLPVISFAFYVCLILVLIMQLVFAVISAALAIINATRNPTEPIFGLPGCFWSNVTAAVLGLVVMLMFGIYWAASGLRDHIALGYVAVGQFVPSPGLGFSYWLLIGAIVCSIANVVLIELRKYLLERDPPPPTIKVENHSDGTIFLY